MTTERVIAKRELRSLAFHETGHAVVCRRFGGVGRADIWRNSKSNIAVGQKAWIGHFTTFAEPGSVTMAPEVRAAVGSFFVQQLPVDWRVMFGMAGLVCERLVHDLSMESWEITETIYQQIEADEVSETDLAAMGESWDESHVDETRTLLLDVWTTVAEEAERLAAQARMSRRRRPL